VRALPDPARAALLLGFEIGDAPLAAAAREAAARAIPIVVNPAPARPLAPELSAAGPILTPNEPEAAALGGAETLAARTGAPVVVTRGARGALIVAPDGAAPTELAAPAVDAVDTTGAGDVFSGVLAAALAARVPLPEAVAEATAQASASVTRAGAR
jgi:ribokinase